MSCGQVHSQARQFVAAGKPTHLVAETLEISRSVCTIARSHEARVPIAATTSASSKSVATSLLSAIAACNGG